MSSGRSSGSIVVPPPIADGRHHSRSMLQINLIRSVPDRRKNYLSGQKRITAEGEKWFVLKSSVLTRIAEMDEFDRLRPAPTSNDMSEVVAEENKEFLENDKQRQQLTEKMSEPIVSSQQSHPTSNDQPRLVATSRDHVEVRETRERGEQSIATGRERELL